MLPDPLVLQLLLDSVCGGQLQSLAISTQYSLALAHVGSCQGETASPLTRGHHVMSDVAQSG